MISWVRCERGIASVGLWFSKELRCRLGLELLVVEEDGLGRIG